MFSSVAAKRIVSFLNEPRHIAPLVVFRLAFGICMLAGTLRFVLKGWLQAFYVKPVFHFSFYGFDWVKAPGTSGLYILFALLIISSLLITVGFLYRTAIVTFFLSFTYVELIDKTTYLNHYYLISILALLMILVPANRYFSVDVFLKPQLQRTYVPRWCIDIFKWQLVLVYFFAGISKINSDWLLDAMPLRIWLPANSHLPFIGRLLSHTAIAYIFSWFGMFFDLFIGFLLLHRATGKPAYLMVILFHLITGWLFKIGLFPLIMIFATSIFLSDTTHIKIIGLLKRVGFNAATRQTSAQENQSYHLSNFYNKLIYSVLFIHFTVQLLLPLRFLLYPGKLYWTEEGYRFSWRVMLMEKGGTAFFYIRDPASGKKTEIINSQYLTDFQEKMMSTQPDMILQFAHFLAKEYKRKGIENPAVTTECYVTLNGSGSRLAIDSTVNLAEQEDTFEHKKWILPFNNRE